MKRTAKIFIAGPLFSSGSIIENIREALLKAGIVRIMGGKPFVPHLYFFWDLIFPQSRQNWLDLDLEWLEDCHAVWRLSGESSGADGEVARAEACNIPVFKTAEGVGDFIRRKNKELNLVIEIGSDSE